MLSRASSPRVPDAHLCGEDTQRGANPRRPRSVCPAHGERRNLYAEKPEVVRELKALLEQYKRDGRSTPGARQKNDPPLGAAKAS